MPVWSLVRYFRIHQGNKQRVLSAYRGDLSREELDAALSYYRAKPCAIDEKLAEITG